jgi:hypothetical protein
MYFKYISSYRYVSEYEVWGDENNSYRIHWRSGYDPYEGGCWNYSPEKYQRDVIGAVSFVYRSGDKISPECFAAFRIHLMNEWDIWLTYCKEKIRKYADDPEIAAIYTKYGKACPFMYPGYWHNGWHQLDYDLEVP